MELDLQLMAKEEVSARRALAEFIHRTHRMQRNQLRNEALRIRQQGEFREFNTANKK